MKEENTNLETTQTTTPVGDTPAPVQTTPVEAPIEMPAPAQPVETPVQAPVDMPAPVVEGPAPVEAPVPTENAPAEVTNLASPDLGTASMSNLDPVSESGETVTPTTEGPSATEIAAGIESGNLVNAVSDPNAMIGAKVGNTADDSDSINKKKSKKNLVVLVVILVILAILGGVGYFVYNYEFKSSNKRVDTMFTKLNSYVLPLLTDVEKRMGDYDIEASATQGSEHKAEFHLNGNYAYNLEDYIYLDTKVDKIYVDEDLLDKTPIEANIYLSEDALYFKIEELFPKYITTDVDGLSDIMNNIKQNDIDYAMYYNAVMNAFKTSLKNYAVSQKVGKTSINGKSQQANIVTVSINKGNYKAFVQNFTTILASNDNFVSSIAKLSGESKDDVVNFIKKAGEEATEDDIDGSLTANFYSPLFGSKLLGVDVTVVDAESTEYKSTYKTTLIPQGNDEWKVTAYEDGDKKTEFTFGFKYTQSSGKKSYVTTFKGEYSYEDSNDEKQVVQLDVKFNYNINVQFQDDKPVTRDAVKLESLTQEDLTTIYKNINEKYGLLGTYFEDIFGSLTGDSSYTEDYDTDETLDALCSQATSCDCSGASCKCAVDYQGYTYNITCPYNA